MQFNPIAGIPKRRLLIVFLAIALLVADVFSFKELPLQVYPSVAPLSVQVITQWPGRSVTEAEQQITIPIESALADVPDVQSFHSVSLFGLSVVMLKFEEGTDSFRARQNFSQYSASTNLPTGVQSSLSPDSDATDGIMRFRLESDGVDLTTLKSYQDYNISKRLRHMQGVTDVSSFGGKVKEYHTVPSSAELLSYGITLSQPIAAIGNANNNTGGNLLHDGEQQFVVHGVGPLQTVGDIRSVTVTTNNDVPVRVCNIAEVEVRNVQRLGQVQYNDQPDAVEGIVLLKRDANATGVLAKVREKVAELNNGILPKNVQVKPFYDRRVLLDITTGTVERMLVVGTALMLAVLFVFLGGFRAAAVMAVATPLTLCVSFISMEHFHVPANLISLGAIDFRVIVDMAAIVMENTMRHLEEGAERLEDAIVKATDEVQRAMILPMGIVIVTCSPPFFIDGMEGAILKPMAFTMGFALMASIVLNLTFVPMATSFIFGKTLHPRSPAFIAAILRWYESLLRKLIVRPMTVFATAITAFSLTLYSATFLGTGFLPTLEKDNLWLCITLSNTVGLECFASVADDLHTYFTKQPKVQKVSVQIGRPDDGTDSIGVFNQEHGLYFAPSDQWAKGMTKGQLVERLSKHLEKIPGIRYNFPQYIQDNVDETLSGVRGENPVELFGDDLNVLGAEADEIQTQLRKVQSLVDVDIFRELGQLTLNVLIGRQAAARFNINVSDIQDFIRYVIGGAPITQILEGEKSFGLAVQSNQQAHASYDAIRELLIDTPDEQYIPLSMIAKVEMTDGPFFIYRKEGKRHIVTEFGVHGRDLGGAMDGAQRMVGNSVKLPESYIVKWDGQFNEMKVAQSRLMVIVPLTILVIFLLLYSTFGNFEGALVVVLSMSFTVIGGLLALHIASETLSISAGIGSLSLFGTTIQDGVILISYVSRLSRSKNMWEATVDSATLCLRLVIMTVMLTGLGLLSTTLSHNIGSEAQHPLALVIVGNMITTTILTLLMLPVVFTWAHRHRRPPLRGSGVDLTTAILP